MHKTYSLHCELAKVDVTFTFTTCIFVSGLTTVQYYISLVYYYMSLWYASNIPETKDDIILQTFLKVIFNTWVDWKNIYDTNLSQIPKDEELYRFSLFSIIFSW